MRRWTGAISSPRTSRGPSTSGARRAREFGEPAGGPFLFGAFCAADAMFAPMVTRFQTYSIPVEPEIRAYMDAVLDLPAFKEWQEAGMRESWVVAHDEVDEPPIGPFRP